MLLISAGHGGPDPGVVANGYKEADLTLDFRNRVGSELGKRGIGYQMDGGLRENLPLPRALSLLKNSLLGVEFHFNSGPTGATGVEALTVAWRPARRNIALALSRAVGKSTGLKLRSYQPEYPGWRPDTAGAHRSLAYCRCGGIILECCFITNQEDLSLWLLKRDLAAAAVADVLAASILQAS